MGTLKALLAFIGHDGDNDIYDDYDDFDESEDDVEETDNNCSELAFNGLKTETPTSGANSDGYIPKGVISLESVTSGSDDTFKLYNKHGVDYVYSNGTYIKISGKSNVTINNVKYKV